MSLMNALIIQPEKAVETAYNENLTYSGVVKPDEPAPIFNTAGDLFQRSSDNKKHWGMLNIGTSTVPGRIEEKSSDDDEARNNGDGTTDGSENEEENDICVCDNKRLGRTELVLD
ncbi:hypothetical protein SNEBB_010847 [Seison nebaliae]|nr:hypothetical protein SNEBB_010847 [Seison nebaliae]